MPVFDPNEAGIAADKLLREIPVALIDANPYQPRMTFEEGGIDELAKSIAQVGLIQPLLVREAPHGEGRYELVAGERRLRAVKSLNMERVMCVVQKALEDETSAIMALIENLQREDLNYFEEAQCYQKMIDNYGLTQEQLAERVGKSQSAVANKLRLLKLAPEVKEKLVESGLTERHARALLKFKDDKTRLSAAEKMAQKGMSVKDAEKFVEKTLDKLYDEKADGAKPRPMIIRLVKDYRLFMNTMNQAVNQLREAGMRIEVEQTDMADGVDIHIVIKK